MCKNLTKLFIHWSDPDDALLFRILYCSEKTKNPSTDDLRGRFMRRIRGRSGADEFDGEARSSHERNRKAGSCRQILNISE